MNIIHISHHAGCQRDLAYVFNRLGYSCSFLGFPYGYNVSKKRADQFWDEKKLVLKNTDLIVTSDTAPLSRIVLENLGDFNGKLIIWICNRFDYCDTATNDCGFPDQGYYDIFKKALETKDKVKVIPYTDFELIYARKWRNVPVAADTIRPSGANMDEVPLSVIPETVDRNSTFFIPPYHNDSFFMDLSRHCSSLGLKCYRGRYSGPKDLLNFKGIVHIPYAWSNFAMFENLYNGIVYFIPSERFLLELSMRHNFFWSPPFDRNFIQSSEWYSPTHKELFVFFDTWDELRDKSSMDLSETKAKIRTFKEEHVEKTIQQWRDAIEN